VNVKTSLPRRRDWLIPALLMVLSLVPAAAGMKRIAELASGSPLTAASARFFVAPLPVMLHLVAVIPFTLLGAWQFAPALRRRWPAWHRGAGRVLVVCGLVSALSGLWMTQYLPWPVGDGEALYLLRLVFGSLMTMAIVMALDAIRRRDFAAHGAWMTRGYAIGMGAGTQVLTHLPWFLLVGRPGESAKAVLMGAGWVINVIVAEWIIRKGAKRRSGQRSRTLTRTSGCHQPVPVSSSTVGATHRTDVAQSLACR
jgi:uncharacterized membrane protein